MTSGVVLDCGDGVCHSTAVFEGYSISNATNRIDIGGRDVTQRLQMLMRRSGYAFHTSSEFEIVRKIKETHCILNTASKQAKGAGDNSVDTITYKMPDGSDVKLKQEVQDAPEILFKPELVGLEYPGVHEILYNTIMKCDVDLRKTLFQEIVVAGGTTLMSNFCKRLHNDVQS